MERVHNNSLSECMETVFFFLVVGLTVCSECCMRAMNKNIIIIIILHPARLRIFNKMGSRRLFSQESE